MRVLIADDEPLAISRLRHLLHEHDDVQIVGEARDGAEAVTLTKELEPDVLLLDIRMPRANGFEVLERLAKHQPPIVIFTTAHSEFGAAAFDVNATDYLLKPFDKSRVQKALTRARRRMRADSPATAGRGAWRERFAARLRGQIFFIKTVDIVWIEAEGNYVRLHTEKGSYLIRESMRNMEKSLEPARFLRVHRSAIVSVDSMEKVDTTAGGGLTITMKNGDSVPLGPNYRKNLQEFMGTTF